MVDIDGASFLSGANAGFIADLYARFVDDPALVDESWRRFFTDIGEEGRAVLADWRPPDGLHRRHRPAETGPLSRRSMTRPFAMRRRLRSARCN